MDNKKWFNNWKTELFEHKFYILGALILLTITVIINYLTGYYVDSFNSPGVQDLFLSLIPPMNLSILFVEGYMLGLGLLIFYPFFFETKKVAYVIYHFSILVIIRSAFLCVTHLGAPIDAVAVKFPEAIMNIYFQNDLFFSGHVACLFLGFLIFKGKIRYAFLTLAVLMGFTVLAMHIHYSIDVFAAPFIAYGTYKMGNWLLKKLKRNSYVGS